MQTGNYVVHAESGFRRLAWSHFAALSLLLTSPSASGAEPSTNADTPQSYIEELTVIGERDKETLVDESHSVAVFNREDLLLATQRDFGELFERIPNAATNERGETVLRGVPQFGIDNGVRGSASTTTFFRDGLGSIVQPMLWDAITAEVSRGPQNELRPSIGGSLAIGSSDPAGNPNGRVRLSWIPHGNERELGLAMGGAITDDLSGRISAYTRVDDGHTKNTTRDDSHWDNYEESLGRVKLLWRPSSLASTTVRFLAEYIDRDFGGGTEVRGALDSPGFDPFERHAVADADVGQREKAILTLVDVTHDPEGPWLLNLAAGWNRLDDNAVNDADGTAQPGSVLETITDFDATGVVFVAHYQGEHWQIRFRQRATHFKSRSLQKNLNPFDLDGPGALPGIITNVQVEVPWPHFYGWTSQVSLARDLGRVRLAGSLTYEGDTTGKDFSIRSQVREPTGIPPLDDVYGAVVRDFFPQIEGQTKTDSADLLPMLSLSFSPGDRTVAGVKWERARRAGGVTVNIARSTLDTYDRERADSFDVFVRATRLDNRLSIAANAFYTRNRNLQLNAVLSTTPEDNQVVNAQKAHTQGLELEASWVDGNWSAFASAGILDTELDKVAVGLSDFSGNEYPFAPRWSASIGASFDPGRGFFAAFDFSLQDDAESTFDNRAGTAAERRQLLNGRVGWRWRFASLSVHGRNLLDDKYFVSRDLDLPARQNQVFYPGDPREVGVTLDLNW